MLALPAGLMYVGMSRATHDDHLGVSITRNGKPLSPQPKYTIDADFTGCRCDGRCALCAKPPLLRRPCSFTRPYLPEVCIPFSWRSLVHTTSVWKRLSAWNHFSHLGTGRKRATVRTHRRADEATNRDLTLSDDSLLEEESSYPREYLSITHVKVLSSSVSLLARRFTVYHAVETRAPLICHHLYPWPDRVEPWNHLCADTCSWRSCSHHGWCLSDADPPPDTLVLARCAPEGWANVAADLHTSHHSSLCWLKLKCVASWLCCCTVRRVHRWLPWIAYGYQREAWREAEPPAHEGQGPKLDSVHPRTPSSGRSCTQSPGCVCIGKCSLWGWRSKCGACTQFAGKRRCWCWCWCWCWCKCWR